VNQPPTWAGRSVPAADSGGPPEQKRRIPILPIIGTVALVALVGGAGFVLGQDDNQDSAVGIVAGDTSSTTEVARTSSIVEALPTTEPSTTLPPTTQPPTTEAPTTEAPTTTLAPTTQTSTTAPVDPAALELDGEERRAVLRGGQVFLQGEVPSEEIAQEIVDRAAAVLGPENVINEYVINPDSSFPESAPLYVEDVVLFAFGSAEINPAFAPLLDLGVALMAQNESVVITVVSNTDSVGSEAFNMRLSERRADAVAQYWLAAGANPAQIATDPRGETNPIADNATPEGAQANRRAEFIIAGLLG